MKKQIFLFKNLKVVLTEEPFKILEISDRKDRKKFCRNGIMSFIIDHLCTYQMLYYYKLKSLSFSDKVLEMELMNIMSILLNYYYRQQLWDII
jgi:hypothetical protein